MKRSTKLISIHDIPMLVFESPECISDDIVKYKNFWDFNLFNKWKKYFPSDGLILDIGANIGSTTLQFKHHFPNLKIWSFEPYFDNFLLLKENTKNFNDIFCFNVGVGSSNSVVTFNDGHESNSGVVKIVNNGKNHNIVLSLDNLIFNEQIKLIKIDIENHELSAFEGMKNLILKDKPLIWLEDLSNNAVDYLKYLGYIVVESQHKTSDFLMIYNSK